ncbi:conserved hypothetical protein [Verticillium alfalfae VaMs.102]|uniref:Vacuolar sorting protein Vps3844 C-terminal domain-containing protein n=1 Tax=Verticillium alfalfae (strain VaMs.102 / ATCC MYA-4576 / FGSC 10136) TaxID=526221 RepID=C9SYC6_VERA1|nr:conserved hypothetical protein [Verticillium alfalfae VaMs.102]EEY23791.1 conserved hypothetical protein [Verticillium alfalfae VaMs.102]
MSEDAWIQASLMKFSLGVAAALAGFTSALQPADVYILQSKQASTSETPSLPRQVARLILLQRLAPEAWTESLNDIPEDVTTETAVSYINQFGKSPQPLFDNKATSEPSQLLVMLEGISTEDAKTLKKTLKGSSLAFEVNDAPSSVANHKLAKSDMASAGVGATNCDFVRAINPFEEECWSGKSSVAVFDVRKIFRTRPSSLLLPTTSRASRSFAQSGEMETTLVLLPETSRISSLNAWSTKPQSLRRRQVAEEVMTEADEPAPTTAATEVEAADMPLASFVRGRDLPSCFASADSCQNSTGNCSGHGKCVNKYAREDGSDAGTCFYCQCESSRPKNGSVTHWAGATCSKVDVSAPFWLFTGFTILMVGILTFSIGLLYSIGEEKLPGVIGAGVSKSK